MPGPWSAASPTGSTARAIQEIITNPVRGSHAAYAITLNGVYYNSNTLASGATWTNITGNLFSLTVPAFGNVARGNPAAHRADLAPGRLAVRDARRRRDSGAATYPVLYVSGDGGVFRSIDNGKTWTDFPTAAVQLDNTPTVEAQTTAVEQGYLPNAKVTSMTMATGNINPQTGRATAQTGDPSLLVATTYGAGRSRFDSRRW